MRGRVTFTAGGQEHCLRFTTNRLCDLEDATGRSVLAFAEALGQTGGISVKDLRLLMTAGLEGHLTQDAVGDLIDEVGIKPAVALIVAAFSAAFAVAGAAQGAPGKAQAGAA